MDERKLQQIRDSAIAAGDDDIIALLDAYESKCAELDSVRKSPEDRILQAMPGTTSELARKSGYSGPYVWLLLKKLRAGDPLTRASHIVGWTRQYGRGGHIAIHGAGPGEDAACAGGKGGRSAQPPAQVRGQGKNKPEDEIASRADEDWFFHPGEAS